MAKTIEVRRVAIKSCAALCIIVSAIQAAGMHCLTLKLEIFILLMSLCDCVPYYKTSVNCDYVLCTLLPCKYVPKRLNIRVKKFKLIFISIQLSLK